MIDFPADDADRREIARLRDELEQLRTALEASTEEVDRLIDDRDRLLGRLAAQARDLWAATAASATATGLERNRMRADASALLRADQDHEELKVAIEEMQVLVEELEAANVALRDTNEALDRRVEERTYELRAKNTALVRSELRFRTLVEGMPQLVWRAIEGGAWTWASSQWTAFTGLVMEESLGLGWLEAVHPDDRAGAEAAWTRARPDRPLEMEGRIFNRAEGRYRHFRTRASAVRADDGIGYEWLGTSTDVDDLHQLRDRQEVLLAELQHRTRNLMGVVGSIFEMTLRSSTDLDGFAARYRGRIDALLRVQQLLLRRNAGDHVTFDMLIRDEIDALGAWERVSLDGPSGVPLRSSTVQTFALALHELATNAVKYGALNQPSGRLSVIWRVAPGGPAGSPWLHVDWSESGVAMPPEGLAPQGSGQGRRLIEHALPYQLGARTTYRLEPDGVRCTIALPVSV